MHRRLTSLCSLGLIFCLALSAGAALRRYRVQLEIMRQGTEILDQRSFWVQELVPRPLDLQGLPEGTTVNLAVSRENESPIVYFQVVAPSWAGYRELTPPRLAISQGSQAPAFCFSLQDQVYRITVTSLKMQEIE